MSTGQKTHWFLLAERRETLQAQPKPQLSFVGLKVFDDAFEHIGGEKS